MSDKMREEFEVWVILEAGNHEYPYMDRVTAKFPDGSYLTTWVDSAWIGWQASRAALCVELPKRYSTDSIGLAYCADAVVDSLDAVGVRYK